MENRIRYIDNTSVFYDIWKNISTVDLRNGSIGEYFLDDIKKANISINQVKDFTWIVDVAWEGHNAKDVEHFRQYLINLGVTRFGAVFTSYVDVDRLPYPAVCLPDKLIYIGRWYNSLTRQHVDWQNLPMTHKVVSLMRRASTSRCHLAKKLQDVFAAEDLVLTLGTGPGNYSDQYKHIIKFPIVVDFELVDNHVEMPHFRHSHLKFYQAPVQVVVESGNELDETSWQTPFVTEKSYKALSWYQFPLWHAVPYFVEKIRQQGFDVFDDIIDHSYDTESNPMKRIDQVVAETKKLCRLDPVHLRQRLWSRLKSNATLVNSIHNTAHSQHQAEITRLKNEFIW